LALVGAGDSEIDWKQEPVWVGMAIQGWKLPKNQAASVFW